MARPVGKYGVALNAYDGAGSLDANSLHPRVGGLRLVSGPTRCRPRNAAANKKKLLGRPFLFIFVQSQTMAPKTPINFRHFLLELLRLS